MGRPFTQGPRYRAMLRISAARLACQSRRSFATGESGAVKEVFLNEIKAVSQRLNAAKGAEQPVSPQVKEAMEAEVATIKARTGLSGVGEVGLSDKIKMTSL